MFLAGLWIRIDFNADPGYETSILAQSGSTKSLNPDPMRIRIQNRALEDKVFDI
jgi:hypothetical protein